MPRTDTSTLLRSSIADRWFAIGAWLGVRALGAITPIGGLCFIAGWVCLAMAATRGR